jgi:hypothetical protein
MLGSLYFLFLSNVRHHSRRFSGVEWMAWLALFVFRFEDAIFNDVPQLSILDGMLSLNPFFLHSDFFHDSSRAGIPAKMPGINLVQTYVIKSKFDQPAGSVRAKAFVPEWDANPISQFPNLVIHIQTEIDRPIQFSCGG